MIPIHIVSRTDVLGSQPPTVPELMFFYPKNDMLLIKVDHFRWSGIIWLKYCIKPFCMLIRINVIHTLMWGSLTHPFFFFFFCSNHLCIEFTKMYRYPTHVQKNKRIRGSALYGWEIYVPVVGDDDVFHSQMQQGWRGSTFNIQSHLVRKQQEENTSRSSLTQPNWRRKSKA